MDAVALLREMVEIPSLSGRERALAEFLVRCMTEWGFVAWVDEVGNAIGVRGGAPSLAGEPPRDIVLLGHMDTVAGWIPVRQEGERLYGRGTVDAKGPLAAFIAAAAQCDPPPGTRLIVIGAVEEESATSRGARHIVSRYAPEACIIGEPSGWDSVTLGYKGRLLADYRLELPLSHTAGPASPVAERAVDWWQALREYASQYNADKPALFDQLLPSLRHIQTSSDGLMERVEAAVGFRLPPEFDVSAFEDFVAERAVPAEVHCHAGEAAFRSSPGNSLARSFRVAIRAEGASPRLKLKTGTSDMNIVGSVWNCPIVAYGPGDSLLDHTPVEHIEIPEFLRAIVVLRAVLETVPESRPRADRIASV